MTPERIQTELSINGSTYTLSAEPRRTLVDTLRDDLELTGTKKVCEMGNCGACTVLVDGRPMYSCLMLTVDCDGRQIRTIEDLSRGSGLDAVQQAFIDADAFQCGFCTPGQVLSTRALLDQNPNPSESEIIHALAGNLCRCGAYRHIIDAAQTAARLESAGRPHAD